MIRTRTRTRGECNRETDRTRRPQTVSISLRERGQTTQDFAIGIGVFILAIAFVFSFLPTVLTPYDSSVTGAETAQADRLADRAVEDLSAASDEPNTIDGTLFQDAYVEADDDTLVERLGYREVGDGVSVRLEYLNGSTMANQTAWEAGSVYENQSAASSARLVRVSDLGALEETDPPNCAPTCRLVVRTW
nr:hypothetical protein [Natronolimnohabitans innermongolicus]